MPKFSFVCEHENFCGESESRVTFQFEKESLFDVIEEFERFLKGAGFVFEGQLDFVKEDELGMRDAYSEEFEEESISISIPPVDSAAWPFPLNDRPSE